MSNVLEFLIKAKDLTSGAFAGLTGKLGGLQSTLASIGSFIIKWAKRAAIAFGAFVIASLKLAGNYQQVEDRLRNVYGNMSKDAADFADKNSKAWSASGREIKGMLSDFGDMAQMMGQTREEALKLAEASTELVYNLAAFKKVKPEEAFDAIRLAMLGNVRSLKRLSIAFEDGEVKAKAMEMGLTDINGKMSKSAQLTATLEVLTKKLAVTQGYAANQSGELSVQYKYLYNQSKAFSAAFGTQIAKGLGLAQILKFLADKLHDVTLGMKETGNVGNFLSGIKGDITQMAADLTTINNLFSGNPLKVTLAIDNLEDLATRFAEFIGKKIINLVDTLNPAGAMVKSLITGEKNTGKDIIQNTIAKGLNILPAISDALLNRKENESNANRVRGLQNKITEIKGLTNILPEGTIPENLSKMNTNISGGFNAGGISADTQAICDTIKESTEQQTDEITNPEGY